MRILPFSALLAGAFLPALALAQPQPVHPAVADVCVYGGTAAGVMAAVAAKREGKSVIIIEPARALGGNSLRNLLPLHEPAAARPAEPLPLFPQNRPPCPTPRASA